MEMKRLITICAVVGLMLLTTSASWATVKLPVSSPPGAPDWWDTTCPYYAYGWWEDSITPTNSSPPKDEAYWASNFLNNTDFTANATGNTITIYLQNEYRADPWYKEIYVYLNGTSTAGPGESIEGTFYASRGTFTDGTTWNIGSNGNWHYVVSGEIHPQPDYVSMTVTVPELTGVTNIWAGENCVPEPATVCLLGLGSVVLLRERKKA
jgi:hypothetical protein